MNWTPDSDPDTDAPPENDWDAPLAAQKAERAPGQAVLPPEAPPTRNPYQDPMRDLDNDAPFTPGGARPPFAGRTAALGRLYALLTDPAGSRSALVLGRRRIGKTAFLHAFDSMFGDAFLGVWIALKQMPPGDELDFILLLAGAITQALKERGFSLARFDALEPPGELPGAARAWWLEQFLPEALGILKAVERGRRLVLLLDDGEHLLNAVRAHTLPADLFTFLRDTLDEFLPLGIVLTLDTDSEAEAPAFAPLISDHNTPLQNLLRLPQLAPEETCWLLQTPARAAYILPDDVAMAIHRATGGAPALVQAFGFHLFQRWQHQPDLNVITLDDVKALTPEIVPEANEAYRQVWARLTANERAVLTSVSQLRYEDPLLRLETGAIETWLIETDFPMEGRAVSAALRSLEYRELILQTPKGILLTAGMMGTWLLENARLPRPGAAGRGGRAIAAPLTPAAAGTDASPTRQVPLIGIVVGGVAMGIVVALLLLALLDIRFDAAEAGTVPQPTVTLVIGE